MDNSSFTLYTENVRTSIYSQPLIASQRHAATFNFIWIFKQIKFEKTEGRERERERKMMCIKKEAVSEIQESYFSGLLKNGSVILWWRSQAGIDTLSKLFGLLPHSMTHTLNLFLVSLPVTDQTHFPYIKLCELKQILYWCRLIITNRMRECGLDYFLSGQINMWLTLVFVRVPWQEGISLIVWQNTDILRGLRLSNTDLVVTGM